MYAVIRAGGKQYRVAPGDVIRVEFQEGTSGSRIEFGDILAISPEEGQISKPNPDTHVIGKVVEQGRGDKILVFHYKRKKQYKKLRGHRQPFTAVRITEIGFNGHKFTAPEPVQKPAPAKKAAAAPVEPAEPKARKAPKKKPTAKRSTAKKAAPKKKK
ncbi:MAG TPA: 50S ribosomal protein L21 [Terriglobales bacterium]|nr:50S ribosomal protein L21 [Terriglobales bacterium]